MALVLPTGVEIGTLTEYSPEIAAEMGNLRAEAFEHNDNQPAREALLRRIIDSPEREVFLAQLGGRLVGSATMNIIIHGWKIKGFLDFFMVSKSMEGQGIGQTLLDIGNDWCRDQEAEQVNWTSDYSRERAHKFYKRYGARIRPTAFFDLALEPGEFL